MRDLSLSHDVLLAAFAVEQGCSPYWDRMVDSGGATLQAAATLKKAWDEVPDGTAKITIPPFGSNMHGVVLFVVSEMGASSDVYWAVRLLFDILGPTMGDAVLPMEVSR